MQIEFIKEGSVTYSPQGATRVTIGQIMECEDETVANALVDMGWAVIKGAPETVEVELDATLVLPSRGKKARKDDQEIAG